MERIYKFVAKEVVNKLRKTVYIGSIEGIPAIYIIPYADILPGVLDSIMSSENPGHFVLENKIETRLIYPATQEHILKYTAVYGYIEETYEEYLKIEGFLGCQWIENIMNKTDNNEKILLETEEYIIVQHDSWNGKNIDSLYLLAFFKDKNLRTIREPEDSQLLIRAKNDIIKLCGTFGLLESDLCMYFHYLPSYFRMHIHIRNIDKDCEYLSDNPVNNFLLDDLIKNITIDKSYYKKMLHFIGFK